MIPCLHMEKVDYVLITQADSLAEICHRANQVGIVSMDTEFMREKVYFGELCLLQMAIEQTYFVIDIIALKDNNQNQSLKPLADLLESSAVTKVFHSCSQDIDVLYHSLGVIPEKIFDTQLAAAFCGHNGQVGYANLVLDLFNIELDKSQTRTDWKRRPLTMKQLEYAANDVVYLQSLYDTFQQKMHDLERMEWFLQESDTLIKTVIDQNNPYKAYKKLNGSNMPLRNQALLKFLANLRENVAQKIDKPRTWILKDSDLYDLANAMPNSEKSLFSLRINSKFLKSQAKDIIHFVHQIEENKLEPVWYNWQPLTNEQKALVKKMNSKLTHFSENQGIARNIIANRKDLEKFVVGKEARFEKGWRAELVGDLFRKEMQG